MGNEFIIIAVIVLLASVMAIVLRHFIRRGRMGRIIQRAASLYDAGQFREATELYLQAEASWSFDLANGSQAAELKRIDELGRLWQAIARACDDMGIAHEAADVIGGIAELRALFQDKGNFLWDGRSMRRAAAVRFADAVESLDRSRRTVGASISEALGR